MAVNRPFLYEVVNWHNVRLAFINAAQPSDLAGFDDLMRFGIAQYSCRHVPSTAPHWAMNVPTRIERILKLEWFLGEKSCELSRNAARGYSVSFELLE
jgi:hypothetical protein